MALAPVLSDRSFHTSIGEKKPPRSKLRGGRCFRRWLIRQFEEAQSAALGFRAKSRPLTLSFPAEAQMSCCQMAWAVAGLIRSM